jgi:hypothetical protein
VPPGSAQDPLQLALYTLLTGDATLMALHGLTGVFDFVDPTRPFPYIVIGDTHEANDNAFSKERRDMEARIHIYSQAGGWQEANDILNRVCQLIDFPAVALAVSGWAGTPQSLFMEGIPTRDPDGSTRQLIGRFRIWLEQ